MATLSLALRFVDIFSVTCHSGICLQYSGLHLGLKDFVRPLNNEKCICLHNFLQLFVNHKRFKGSHRSMSLKVRTGGGVAHGSTKLHAFRNVFSFQCSGAVHLGDYLQKVLGPHKSLLVTILVFVALWST